MRKIIASVYVSLDGVMENPAWTMPFWNTELAEYAHNQLFASDALLLGRVTYEGFAQAWPGMTDEQGFADRMNALPKFVVSATLTESAWNATFIPKNVAGEVLRLKQQPGQDLLIYGSAGLVQTLMPHDLIDEYQLWLNPVVVGSGKRLFSGHSPAINVELADSKTFSTGVVLLKYRHKTTG
jgi:dihydrofolate reductase